MLTDVAVTGWKSVYVNRGFTKRINGVTKDESDMLLQYLFNVRCPARLIWIKLTDYSSSRKTTTPKSGLDGTAMTWLSGITGRPGTARRTTTRKHGLETACVVWEKRRISTRVLSLGGRRWLDGVCRDSLVIDILNAIYLTHTPCKYTTNPETHP